MTDNETVHVQMSRRTAETVRTMHDILTHGTDADYWKGRGVLIILPPDDVAAVLYALTVLTPAPQQDGPPCP